MTIADRSLVCVTGVDSLGVFRTNEALKPWPRCLFSTDDLGGFQLWWGFCRVIGQDRQGDVAARVHAFGKPSSERDVRAVKDRGRADDEHRHRNGRCWCFDENHVN